MHELSRHTLRALLVATTSPAIWRQVLEALGDDIEGDPDDQLLEQVVSHAHAPGRGPVIIAGLLERAVGATRPGARERSLTQIASEWTRVRDTASPRAIAALLWRIARDPSAGFRVLEDRVVGHLHVRAMRAMQPA